MKLALVSDFHFGFNEDSFSQAQVALQKAFDCSDFVILAGDLFDSRVQKYEILEQAINVFKAFSNVKVRDVRLIEKSGEKGENGAAIETVKKAGFVAIPGTHERRAKGLVNVIQLFDSMGLLLNVHNKTAVLEFNVLNQDGSRTASEKIAIYGLCGMPEEIFKVAIKGMQITPVDGCFNVFVFHQSLKEASAFGDYASIRDLPAGFDLYVDGHIHLRQDFGDIDGRRVILPGSTVVTQMKRNETEKKGFYLFDTISRTSEFVEIESRPFVFETLEFKDATFAEVESKVREVVSGISASTSNAMVKLKLSGSLSSGLLARDISLANIISEFEKSGLKLAVDLEFSSNDLKERIAFLRNLRDEHAGIKEVGVGMLRDKLKGISEFHLNPEVLFDTLLEGDLDKSFDFLKAENSKPLSFAVAPASQGSIATN